MIASDLDPDRLGAFLSLKEVVQRAAWRRPDAVAGAGRVLESFERALAAGESSIDAAPWCRFVTELCGLIATLENGPLPKLQSGWIAVLKQIREENCDLLEPASAFAVHV